MTRYGIKMKLGSGYLAPLMKGTWGATFTADRQDAWHTIDRDEAEQELKSAQDWCRTPLMIVYFRPDEELCDVAAVNGARPCSI